MSDEQERNWPRDVLIIPIVVGLIIAVGTYFVPKLLDKGKRLSYEIDGPTSYANTRDIPGVLITVNGAVVSHLFGYRVRLWNSGDAAIDKLPVQVRFSPQSPSEFKILNVKHETIPKEEFGKIEEQGGDATSKRFVFELLNRRDEDTITLVTNEESPLTVYSKAENLRVEEQKRGEGSRWSRNAKIISTALSAFAALLALVLKYLAEPTVRKIGERIGSWLSR